MEPQVAISRRVRRFATIERGRVPARRPRAVSRTFALPGALA